MSKEKRYRWIDVLRGIAILVVIFDHALDRFPALRNVGIGWHTFFAVNWFIFLSALTNTLQANKYKWIFPASFLFFWKKKLLKVVPPAFLATIIYYIYSVYFFHTQFNPKELLVFVFTFKKSSHFYFIVALLQLYLLFPFLYLLMKRLSFVGVMILLGVIAWLTMKTFPLTYVPWNYVTPMEPIGRAYLFVFAVGIAYPFIPVVLHRFTIVISFISLLFFEFYLFYSNGIFATSIPNLLLAVWSLVLIIPTIKLVKLPLVNTSRLAKMLSYLGKHSLFIYLFHFLILIHFTLTPSPNIPVIRLLYFFLVIIITIFISLGVEFSCHLCMKSFHYKKAIEEMS